VVTRSRAYHLLDLDEVSHRLVHAPDQVSTHAESGMTRTLYDCVSVPLTPAGPEVRLVVATHTRTSSDPSVGVERDGTLRLLYAARIGPCRACPLRAQCQESSTTLKPRRKSRGALAALLFSRRILAAS